MTEDMKMIFKKSCECKSDARTSHLILNSCQLSIIHEFQLTAQIERCEIIINDNS